MNQPTETSETTQETHHVLIVNQSGLYTIQPRTLHAARGDQVTFVAVGAKAYVTLFFSNPELFEDQEHVVTLRPDAGSATLTVGSQIEHNVYPYAVYSEERRDFVGFSPPQTSSNCCCSPPHHAIRASFGGGPVIIVYNGY